MYIHTYLENINIYVAMHTYNFFKLKQAFYIWATTNWVGGGGSGGDLLIFRLGHLAWNPPYWGGGGVVMGSSNPKLFYPSNPKSQIFCPNPK